MPPHCARIPRTAFALEGPFAEYLRGVTAQWLAVAPDANPAMLDIFRDRDRRPRRDLVPWAGEFAGKYLTSAVQVLRLTGDDQLRAYIRRFVAELVALQDEDGYLGPWPRRHRLTGKAPNVGGKQGPTWDAWGHYHIMLGLLLWYEDTGDKKALACVRRIGDLLCDSFLGKKRRRLVDTGSSEMNLAVVHSLCLLYGQVKEGRYLELARQIVDEFAATGPDGPAGDYLQGPLRGVEFHQGPKPRWESLHPIMGLAELYWLTGDDDCRRAFERTWWSILRHDRHNNGGFSSAEKAQGDPYHPGAIETCCTVAWMALGVEMLKMTGQSVVADELELSTLNSALGWHSHTGRWVTYNTPMDGVRRASAHDIVFQAREGSPELNCCSVNGPRSLGMLSDWALMRDAEGMVVNWYGPCRMEAPLGRGQRLTLVQETDYPRRGRVHLRVEAAAPIETTLKLRVPYWSARTRVRLNGDKVDAAPGTYLALKRRWQEGDQIQLELDMRPHFWAGHGACRGLASMYRGPLLLAYDRRFNDMDPDDVPPLDAADLKARLLSGASRPPCQVQVACKGEDGRRVVLCDFASAGEGGSPYRSWLIFKRAPRQDFSPENPLRSSRP